MLGRADERFLVRQLCYSWTEELSEAKCDDMLGLASPIGRVMEVYATCLLL